MRIMRVCAVAVVLAAIKIGSAHSAENNDWKHYLARHPEPGACHSLVKSGFEAAAAGKNEQALADLEEAQKAGCGADDGLVLARMAFLHRLGQNPKRSLAYYKKALPKLAQQYPENRARVLALYNVGYLLEQKGDVDAAMEGYRRALALDPTFQNARTSLRGLIERAGLRALGAGDAQLAAKYAKQALAVQDEIDKGLTRKDAKGRRGVLMLALRAAIATDNGEAAAEYHDELLTIANNQVAITVGGLWREAGKPDHAAAAFVRAAELDPEDVNALMLLGEVREGQERWRDAAAAYERAHKRLPKNADILYALGYAHFAGGDYKAARAAFKKVLKVQPDHAAAKDALQQLGG